MTFPNGSVKDGYFENNVFKGETASPRLIEDLKELRERENK